MNLNELQITPEEKTALIAKWYDDPGAFMTDVLGHWFYEPLTWMHRGYIALVTKKTSWLSHYGELDKIIENFVYRKKDPWDDEEQSFPIFRYTDETKTAVTFTSTKYLEAMLPRGIGKTTVFSGCIIWLGCYKETDFVMLLGETLPHAKAIGTNIQGEFEVNQMMLLTFGNQKGDKWTEDIFELKNGFIFKPGSRDSQVRGTNWRGIRPTLLVLDDVEDEKSVLTAEQKAKTRKWFIQAVLPALKELEDGARIILSGTLLASDALLATIGKDPTFTTIVLGALDVSGEPVFPSYMNLEKLKAKKELFERNGELDGYYLEYFNKISNEVSRKLKREYIQYGGADSRPIAMCLAHDPAISKKKKADYAAYGVTYITSGLRFINQYYEGFKGLTPTEAVEHFWKLRNDFCKVWEEKRDERGNVISEGIPIFYLVESVAYQEALVDLLKEKMVKENDYFQVEPMKYTIEKHARIMGTLEPRYRSKNIYHTQQFVLLENQLKDFPRGNDDLLDVEAMCIGRLQDFITESHLESLDSEEKKDYYNGDWDTPMETGGI